MSSRRPKSRTAENPTEAFDEHTVNQVADLERIKAVEFKHTLADLAGAHVHFFHAAMHTWASFLADARR